MFNCRVTMSRKYNLFNYQGNCDGTPYSSTVSASLLKYSKDQSEWIDAMPNNYKSLEKLKKSHISHHHFHCDWITVGDGGK